MCVFSRQIDWCYKLIARIWRENKLRAHLFRRATLQPETEDKATRANQKSASKFSVKSQHHLIIMILFYFPGSNFYLP